MKKKYNYTGILPRLIIRVGGKSLLLIGLLLLMFTALQAQEVVKGVVRDDTGEPLPGVYIESESGQSTETDANGKYTITAKMGETLTFSFIGKKDVIKKVTRSMLDVVLRDSSATQIDEVVITALGIKREKKALRYAVQQVNPDDLQQTGNPNLAGALQGKVAGIDIKPSSGMPGASSQIVIRGARSFTGNNTPLYVVDGMPIASTPSISTGDGNGVGGPDIANRGIDIDPNDIVGFTVLKGQAAAALYGMRASNGAVIITTRNGKGLAKGKPVVTINQITSFDRVSRKLDYQTTWAQGYGGKYNPNGSTSWGPKITDLPNDPDYGGNGKGHEGMYKVIQLEQAGLDPWVKPGVYNNYDDYFNTGITSTTGINVAQATENGHFSIGLGHTDQTGIAHNTGMKRWNAKAAGENKLNDQFTTGFSANFISTDIDKLRDNSLTGIYFAPITYNLKGIPYHVPNDLYKQIYYRRLTFDNPYWVEHNNTFNEHTDRFFGNGFVKYATHLADAMDLTVKYQLGVDSYTTHYQDIYSFGSRGDDGNIRNYGVTDLTYNSLLTANYDWKINHDLHFNAILGNEINHDNDKRYQQDGEHFNFGGWNHIKNAKIVTSSENHSQYRTAGFFGSLSLSWKEMLFLNATGRNDIVSSMPRGNRSFFYPSASLGFIASELNALKKFNWLSFAKFRASYAEVGEAGAYLDNFFVTPLYVGGFWKGAPISYPLQGGVSSYIASATLYDPNLKPQNTSSYELGVNLKFLHNRIGIDYTYSRQNVKDQIFAVPLAGDTGARSFVTNGGKLHTDGHEVIFYVTPVRCSQITWDMNINFSKIKNVVDELAPGVDDIFLGGFQSIQVRVAAAGNTYPVIYGTAYKKDTSGRILVDEDPDSDTYGMPMAGEPGVIGSVSPDFIVGLSNSFRYKDLTLGAVLEWKQGGQIYSGSNSLLDLYGLSKRTEDRQSTFIYDGYKEDGSKNDIVRGGPDDPNAYQTLYLNILSGIGEANVYDNSFVKLRELSLKYDLPIKILAKVNVSMGAFVRNLLLWSKLPNFDPESSQGNNNMAGGFERISLPQTTSYGFTLSLKF